LFLNKIKLQKNGFHMKTPSAEELRRIYPESDGQPMAENTLQLEWIVLLKWGLEACFDELYDVFVAADLLWYPVEGHPEINVAPDVMVAFGRPKGHRGSYIQFIEDNIPPQVVFEIISPGNRKKEMDAKLAFYQQYGVEEYYLYNPHKNHFSFYLRKDGQLIRHDDVQEWVSPRLKVKFEWNPVSLNVFEPEGDPFLSYHELKEFKKQAIGEFQKNWAFQAKDQRKLKELVLENKWALEKIETEREKIKVAQEQLKVEQKKTKVAQEKTKVAQEKAEVELEKAKVAQEKTEAAQEQINTLHKNAITALQKAGLNPAQIAQSLGLSEAEVNLHFLK